MSRCALVIAFAALVGGCANARAVAPRTTASAVLAQGPATQATPLDEPASPDRPVPKNGPWIGGAAASEFILAGQRDQLVGVWVDMPDQAALSHVPVAVALAIDTSGSMQGDKIAHARAAAREVVERLVDGDLVALVTFDSHARTGVGLTRIDAHTRARMLSTISELDATGGTALHDGVKLAEVALLSTPDTHLVRRVVVISDGQATVGPTDPHTLGNLAEVGMTHGIQVTSLGVGLDYDEVTLDAFAVRSSGRLYHLENSKELVGIIAGEMNLLGSTAAANAEVEIVPAPEVALMGIDAVRSVRAGSSLRVPLGALYAGQRREMLVRVHLSRPLDEGRQAIASLRLHFRDPGNDGVPRVHEDLIGATFTGDKQLVAEHENGRTQAIIAMREAALLAASASSRANEGDLAMADADLGRAEQALRDRAGRAKDQVEKKRLLGNAQQIVRARKSVSSASKAAPAAKKAKGRAAALELNDAAMAFDGY